MKLLLIGALILSTSAFADYSTTTKKTTTTSPTASAETTDITGATDEAIKTQEERMEETRTTTEQRMEDASDDLGNETKVKKTKKEIESIDTTPAPSSTPSSTPSTTAP